MYIDNVMSSTSPFYRFPYSFTLSLLTSVCILVDIGLWVFVCLSVYLSMCHFFTSCSCLTSSRFVIVCLQMFVFFFLYILRYYEVMRAESECESVHSQTLNLPIYFFSFPRLFLKTNGLLPS